MSALSIAGTGMLAQQLNVEVISNNIANMNTTGFKRQRAVFQDLIYQNLLRVGTQTTDSGTIEPSGIQIGVGVNAGAVYRITEQGSLTNTGNDLDMAIQGKGYFRITLSDGSSAYTRAGTFQLSPTGLIVTQDGLNVAPGLTVPNDAIDITINQNGEVLAIINGQVTPTNVGQIELVSFANESGLEAVGDNLLLETAASGTATPGVPGVGGNGTILQGFLETSNVNPVAEVTSLITAQRAYEMNSRVITTADEMLRTIANLR
ncbi:MAG: flagellar basal-body rod protein FlgG [Proteobacteria bacterium]|nr:flagellar basal-body rod protein FlgG [Pseudomonadota bacterium]